MKFEPVSTETVNKLFKPTKHQPVPEVSRKTGPGNGV